MIGKNTPPISTEDIDTRSNEVGPFGLDLNTSDESDLTEGVSLWLWLSVIGMALLGVVIIAGSVFRVEYVALTPGSARDVEPLLAIDGLQEYPSEGELLFTTIKVKDSPNFWQYLWYRMDDDVKVLPAAEVFGDRTAEESREFNLELMNDTKQKAVGIALQTLGYDVIKTDAVVVYSLVEGSAVVDVLEPGDSITAINGSPVNDTVALVESLNRFRPGDSVTLTVESFGAEVPHEVAVVLGTFPDEPDRPFLGIKPVDRIYFDDKGFSVEIDSGSVGGPSAGLAFTLAVLDQLTEGDLTGGHDVAVTGTIGVDGHVGLVGGVAQKLASVRDLGVEYFLVPEALGAEELDELAEVADEKVQVIAVSTLDDALDELAELGGDVEKVRDFEPMAQ